MTWTDPPRTVVTGAASGLGRAFCLELTRRGASIVAADIDADGLEETRALCVGTEVHVLTCDVSDVEAVEHLADEAERLLGGVDLVVNNAGVAAGGRVGEIPMADWRWCLGVNLWGVIHGCHVFVPRLRRQAGGHVINVASMAGLMALPTTGPYTVSKFGVVGLSEVLSEELEGSGVGVTVLCPSFFPTQIAKNGRGPEADEQRQLLQAMFDASRLTAADVARMALEAARAGRLYALPMIHGRVMWLFKRLFPRQFGYWAPRLVRLQARRLGVDIPWPRPS